MISIWSVGMADSNMAEEILTGLTELIRRHPWWQARARLTMAVLDSQGVRPPARVLDVGCGWGVTLAALERRGYHVVGVDISRCALQMLERERPNRELVEADLTQALPQNLETYEAVLALDVIEHLDDDRAAVERLGQLTAPGGIVVVSVPALPEMFSEFDTIQGHRRRYLPETLRNAFIGTGLHVEQVFWWGSSLVPVLRRQRKRPSGAAPGETLSQTYKRYLRLPPWPGTLLLRAAFSWEQGRTLAGKSSVGTSLIAVARRPGETPSG
jgi:2-polyprenyl-3-methyl-5-hydroxy-6-metoxy-1,4-benzoquinol methylase